MVNEDESTLKSTLNFKNYKQNIIWKHSHNYEFITNSIIIFNILIIGENKIYVWILIIDYKSGEKGGQPFKYLKYSIVNEGYEEKEKFSIKVIITFLYLGLIKKLEKAKNKKK